MTASNMEIQTVKFFGQMLLGVREFRKLTPAQVGQAVGVSASTISSIEKGGMPQMVNFLRLCRWMGVKPSVFLDADIDMPVVGEPEVPAMDAADFADLPQEELV